MTGGAGFIGSHLVDALVKKGHRVRVLDNFFSGKRENLRGVRGRGRDASRRLRRSRRGTARRRGIDAVLHEAAVPSVARSVEDPALSHSANATATLTCSSRPATPACERFIYAGSSSVYGDTPTLPKHEGMTPQPLSPYAVGKLTGEHYLRVFARLYGMETLTHPLLQCLRSAAGPELALQRRHQPIHDGPAPGEVPLDQRRRASRAATSPTSTNVVDANLRALTAKGLAGQVGQRGHGAAHHPETAPRSPRPGDRPVASGPVRSAPGGGHPAQPRRHSPGPQASGLQPDRGLRNGAAANRGVVPRAISRHSVGGGPAIRGLEGSVQLFWSSG